MHMSKMAASVNPALLKERSRSSFDRELLTNIIDGGEWFTTRRREIEKLVINDPEFQGPEYHFLSRDEIYEEGMRKTVAMNRKIKDHGLTEPSDLYWFRSLVFPNESAPAALHTSMFIPTLNGQATDEQKANWLQKAENNEIIGTYAQTELGHGTFIRGLETTATYDARTDEFVINSPTPTSTKWWPGSLGKTSDHAVVIALMYINGKNHGPHPFMVQLRDTHTHRPLPGITLGDIGPKFGYTMIDNGFLRMDHVRIPRQNLLMKNSKVLKDGTYVKAKHAKLSYGTMVFVRAMIVWDIAAKCLGQACTIAIRYSCVRRQSELKPGQGEPPVLDFQSQQYRLFTQLATAYAFTFAGMHMRNMYFSINAEIMEGNVDALPELHGLSSGLKAYTTHQSGLGIETCRLCCGGHGYAHYSGIPKIYVNATPACTYEGENNVMLLQCARYLMKCAQMARRKEKMPETVAYLSDNGAVCSLEQNIRLGSLVDAYRHRAKRLVLRAVQQVDILISKGLDQHDAWNQSHVLLMRAAEVHIQQYIMKVFADRISEESDTGVIGVLTRLAQLYGLRDIIEQSGDFLEDGYLSPAQLRFSQQKFYSLLGELRPDAVTLVDAFDFPDRLLGSAIGSYNGNAYENIIKFAKESPLNKNEVHPAVLKYLKPPSGIASKL